MKLSDLAMACQAELRGDPGYEIDRVATIETAGPHDITFLANEKYIGKLTSTRAGAVILSRDDCGNFSGNVLVSDNPRLCCTRAVQSLHPAEMPLKGCHPTAAIDPGASVAADVSVGANAVIESGAKVDSGVVIGAGGYIGRDASIGSGSWLHAHVSVGRGCIIGRGCILHYGAVIGSDGFGYARDGATWVKTPQVGRAVLGDDVEIGANTTVDRGALDDTLIGRGVKLDNLIQIGHNVVIGEDTAIAACTAIAGSTHIGKRCTIAGQVGIVGHIQIADDVVITGATVVTHTTREPGTYSSGSPLEPYARWLKNAVRMRQLDEMARRLRALEQKIFDLQRKGET